MTAGPPVFGPEFADCPNCELRAQCDKGRWVAARPARAEVVNGLMIIGEAPRVEELSHKKPIAAGRLKLLEMLTETAGIDLNATHYTNAILCAAPAKDRGDDDKSTFVSRFPTVVPSCLPRLEAEIEFFKPRGIVALGHTAVTALTGTYHEKIKQVPNPCEACKDKRKVGPALACAKGDCDWWHLFSAEEFAAEEHKALLEETKGKCPKCQASIKRLKVRQINCPSCGGRKTQLVPTQVFKAAYGPKEVAGGLFYADQLPERVRNLGVEWVVCTYDPAWIIRTAGNKSDDRKTFGGQFAAGAGVEHLIKVSRLLSKAARYDLEVELTDDPDDIREFTAEVAAYEVDTETNAKSPWDVSELRCVGIGRADRSKVLVVDTRRMLDVRLEEVEGQPTRFHVEVRDQPLFDALCAFLVDPERPKSGMHFKYDRIVLKRLLGVWAGPIWGDCMVDHHILAPDEPHDLGHIAAEMTFTPHWKEPKSVGGVLKYEGFGELAGYNAHDVRNQALSAEAMRGRLHKEEVVKPTGVKVTRWSKGGRIDDPALGLRSGHDVSTAVFEIASRMEYNGIPLHLPTLREIEEEKRPELDKLLEDMRQIVGRDDWNPDASADVIWAFYSPAGPCKLTAPLRTKTGGESADKNARARLRGQHPLVDLLDKYKKLAYVFSNYLYGKKLLIREDGFFHPKWNTCGPVTFRWSTEPNVQNWPEWLRRAVRAPDGWVIVGADESQLELRFMAGLCGDPELIRRCVEADEKDKLSPERDPHSFVASRFFGPTFVDLDESDPIQKAQKTLLRYVIKCAHPDTIVHTLWGARTLRSLVPQEGTEGRYDLRVPVVVDDQPTDWTRATAWMRTEAKKMVHVATRRGILTCSRDHRLVLANGEKKAAQDLLPGDALVETAVPVGFPQEPIEGICLPGGMIRGLPAVEVRLSDEWGYLAGMFLGDGTVSGSGVAITHGDPTKIDSMGVSYQDWTAQIAEAIAAVGFVPKQSFLRVSIGDRHAARVLGQLGLTTHKPEIGEAGTTPPGRRNLRVPDWILRGTRERALAFFAGLVDTDGYLDARTGSARVTTKDAVFAGQLCVLARMLGFVPSVDPQFNKTYQRYYWTIRLRSSDTDQLAGFMRHPGKRARAVIQQRAFRPPRDNGFVVKLVEPAEDSECIDLQVDNAAHVYMQNGLLGSNSTIYATNYGAGAFKIHQTIYNKGYDGPPISVQMVGDIVQTLFTLFERLPIWRDNQYQTAMLMREVRSPILGRCRPFPLPPPWGGVEAPTAYNFPSQSGSADLIDLCTIEYDRRLAQISPRSWLFAQVHDAVYTLCPEEDAEKVRALKEECYTQTLRLVEDGPEMPFVATGKIGQTWDKVS